MGKELFKNIPSKVGDLVKDVRNGRIGLPDLQRPFVWRDNKVRELFDSMLKGYPIGYIMLWESPVDYESKKSTIGDNSKTYEEPKELVIDGQQRLTALVAAMFAVKVKDKNFADREIKISYNPLTREFAVWSQAYEKDTEWISRISDVFLAKEDNSISSLRRHFIKEANEGRSKKGLPLLTDEEEDRIEDSINALLNLSDYSLPTLEISYNADEEDVADIFVRVNSGGQSLTENNFIQTLISVYENETSNKMQDRQRIKGDAIDFEGYNPKKVILEQLRAKPEIDYEKCSKLLFKLITQVCDHYETRYGTNGMQNIIMMYKRDIGNKIYKQMLQHFYCENGFLQEEVVGTRDYNLQQSYSCAERVNLFSDDYTGNIQSVLFEGVKRGVFSAAKFDSRPELVLARVLETDTDVQNWLRPAPQEFNITYNHGHNYEPDFVVETDDTVYLVEVKGEDKLSDPDVIAKKKRGIQYCEVASRWGKANGYKQWRYLFIPSKQIMPNSSFMQLAKQMTSIATRDY